MSDMYYCTHSELYISVLAERCYVYERCMYCTLLSGRLVVSFISTFSDVHSVDVLHFLITASTRWFCTVLHWITCADVVALMMMTSSALHRAWSVTAGIRATGFAHLRPGVELVVHFASSTSIQTIYVIRKFTEYVTDKYSSKSFQA